ncbi:hypothetical protein [Hydrogenophaga sp.]|uniref:hypothetical protein n=1 Tax=Hydrogenophaga sp. TaxID=1904254 RepID=UPI003D104709
MVEPSVFAAILSKVLELWTKPVFRFGVQDGRPTVELFPERYEPASLDERIQRIDAARRNLIEALDAIDELKAAAEENKAELAAAIERLNSANRQRVTAERELAAVRDIAQSDIDVFKKLAGIPSQREIAKERFIGFLLGIAASIAAAGLWKLGDWVLHALSLKS